MKVKCIYTEVVVWREIGVNVKGFDREIINYHE